MGAENAEASGQGVTDGVAAAIDAEGPPPPPRRVEWRKGLRALRAILADPERTDQVFVMLQAFSGDSGDRLYQKVRTFAEGRRLLAERPALLPALRDRARLAALPAGSLGRAYADFMASADLSPDELVDASAARASDLDARRDPEQRWFFERLRDMHDLWHVLTGYGRDVAGEAALLAFSYAQTRQRAIGLLVLAAAFRGPKTLDCHWQRYLVRAWWRGRRAALLPMAPFETLLPKPLDEVRRTLHIDPPEAAHPGGVLVAEAAARAA